MAYVLIRSTDSQTFPVRNVAIDTFINGAWHRDLVGLTFERSTTEELDELKHLTPAEVIRRKLKGWIDVQDDQRTAVPFTPENLEGFVSHPPALAAAVRAFWDHQIKVERKN